MESRQTIHGVSSDYDLENPSQEHLLTEEPRHSYDQEGASILSLITFHWLTPLVWLGYKRPLELTDLTPLKASKYGAMNLTEMFEAFLQQEQENVSTEGRPCNLVHVIWRAFGPRWAVYGLLKFLSDIATLMTPVVMTYLISTAKLAVDDEASWWTALYQCFALFLLMNVASVCLNYYFQKVMTVGFCLRTSLNGAIYHKVFRLNQESKSAFSSGKLVNLMSLDTARLDLLAGYLHYIWSGPMQVLLIIGMLAWFVGWPALVGIGILLLSIPCHHFLIRKISSLRQCSVGIADERVKLLQEILNNIRLIKTFHWEDYFTGKILDFRSRELKNIKILQIYKALLQGISMGLPLFACVTTFSVKGLIEGELRAEEVFPSLALFNLLRIPLILFPSVMGMIIDAKVALKRLQDFFLLNELHFRPTALPDDSKLAIKLEEASFSWTQPRNFSVEPANDRAFRLRSLSLQIKKGSLVAIIGPVGSGKSSLLSALVGEMNHDGGQVLASSLFGYCPQQAFILNATIRDNILFGNTYDEAFYRRVLKDCALEADLDSFINGDLTEIGEKGITLSGGQKQRISLARMLYAQAKILLMDDPLSAVDSHVGHYIFDRCIKNISASPLNHGLHQQSITRILVTHQLWVLRHVDYIVAFNNGEIEYQGTYSNLLENEPKFFKLLEENNISTVEGEAISNVPASKDVPDQIKSDDPKSEARMNVMQVEERALGAVASTVYSSYFSYFGSSAYLFLVVFLMIATQLVRVLTDLWLSRWTTSTSMDANYASYMPDGLQGMSLFLFGYVLFGVFQMLFTILSALSFSFGGVSAGRQLFSRAFSSVIQAKLVFFDTTPLGRIVNRFSKDVDGVDNMLIDSLRSLGFTLMTTLTSLTFMASVTPAFIAVLAVMLFIYFFLQLIYRSSTRELKRLDSLTKSPLVALFAESLGGLSTIRASGRIPTFLARNFSLSDVNNLPLYYQITLQRWMALRLEAIGNFILLTISLLCLAFNVEPGILGLLVSYALGLHGALAWAVRQAGDAEVQMNSVERLLYYEPKNIEAEPDFGTEVSLTDEYLDHQSLDIPAVEFKNVSIRYRPELRLSLINASFQIKRGERVGILGRTGAGKSTILAALFRLTELDQAELSSNEKILNGDIEGNVGQPGPGIYIFGKNIVDLPMKVLRGHFLTVILQDPSFFSTTIRLNLDPLSSYTEKDLWDVLELVNLSAFISSECPLLLDTLMTFSGDPFSLGQRQLLALARALLKMRKCKYGVLVMDEATANIDMSTDALIQQTLTKLFVKPSFPSNSQATDDHNFNWTVITIAHRISTIIDYDKVILLDQGKVVEIGSPHQLSKIPSSLFYSLLHASSSSSSSSSIGRTS